MSMEKTFAIIKPDACSRNIAGKVLSKIEENGFQVIAMKKLWMTKEQAEGFYAVHRGKPFFSSLTDFMSSGPCIVMVLQKENAIAAWRKLMGATNPANAEPGTIRKDFAQGCGRVDLPGSDPDEMYASLRKLASLPDDTVLYPGHDYGGGAHRTMAETKRMHAYLRIPNLETWRELMGAG